MDAPRVDAVREWTAVYSTAGAPSAHAEFGLHLLRAVRGEFGVEISVVGASGDSYFRRMLNSILRRLRWLTPSLLLVTSVSSAAFGQARDPGGLGLKTSSFVFARYATESASALYAARGLGPIGGFVAMIQNPKTSYRELIGGVFTQMRWGRQSVLFAVAYADASESAYVQTYIAPTLTRGRLTLSATAEWYEPLESSGTRQLDVNPASLMARVSGNLSVGAAYTVGLEARQRARSRAGPAMELALPWGTLRVELLDRLSGGPTELRPSIFAAF